MTWIKSNWKKVLTVIGVVVTAVVAVIIGSKLKPCLDKKKYDKKIDKLEAQEKEDEKIIIDTGYTGHNDDGTIK